MTPLHRTIAFLAGTRLAVNTSHRFVFPFLPAIARGLGISLESAGLLLSARSLAFVATPAVVATVGRGERRVRLAVGGLAMMAVGAMVTAITGVLAGALIGFVLLGLGKPAFDAAAQAYVADRTPYDRRARFLSILELTWAGGLLVGAPAVGWLIDRQGWRAPFFVLAAVFTIAALLVPRMMEGDTVGRDTVVAPLRPTPPMVALLVAARLFSVAAETTFIVFGAWLEDGFALSLAALGLASTSVAVAELAGEGAVLAFADRLGPRRMVLVCLGASVAGYLALATTGESLAGFLAVLAITFIAVEMSIVATVPLATEVEPAARSRFLALLMVALGIGRAIGSAIGPVLYGWQGVPATALTSAAAAALALIVLLTRFPATDR